VLLALFIPVAAFAWFITRENNRALKAVVVAAFLVWGAVNLVDHVTLLREYTTNPPPNKFRHLADYLVAGHVKYAWAPYWDAYIVDFMTREQVVVASTGKVRVAEYQRLVEAHRDEAIGIRRMPCSGGIVFDSWCIDPPGRTDHGGQK
jgi:hypothetical protein